MSLDLDARQRAMLAEMGVKLWARPGAPAAPYAIESEATNADQSSADSAKHSEPPPGLGTRLDSPAASVAPAFAPSPAPSTARAAAAPAATSAPTPIRADRTRPPTPAAAEAPVPFTPPLPGVDQMDWATLQATVADCRACALCATRTQTVFGVGAPTASWMVVGEAPGEQEDLRGKPFVGQAGQLLDQMLAALGLTRSAVDAIETEAARAGGSSARGRNALQSDVYIAHVLKCRPPGNRNPEPSEIAQCEPYLRRQVALVRPRIILAMGRFAVQSLLQTSEPIGRLRGRVHHYQGVPVIVTYHPAYLLRARNEKAKAWQDLCLALATYEAASAHPPA